jgi:hypothetical protein
LKQQPFENFLQLQELSLIKIKARLGMGFIYKELNECDKAIECINEAEAINIELSTQQKQQNDSMSYTSIADETFTYAKFSIYCKANDILAAEASL